MFNILSQRHWKSNFSGMKSSTAFSLHWWMTSHVFIQKMHYSFTSCKLYFVVPLSSFLAHLLALSHIYIERYRYIRIYVSALKIYEGTMNFCKDTLWLYVISAGNIHLSIETFLLLNSCILGMLHPDCLVHWSARC